MHTSSSDSSVPAVSEQNSVNQQLLNASLIPPVKKRGTFLENRPYILRFKTSNNYYVYDVNLNSVVRVDSVVWSVVKDFGALTRAQMIKKYSPRFSVDDINKALELIESYKNQQGYFSSNRPGKIVHPLDEMSLRLLYEERLQSIVFELTEQCNLRCSYCPYSGTYDYFRPHNSKHMTFEIAKKGIDLLFKNSKLSENVTIAFYGGEPLIGFKLMTQIVSYANQLFDRKPIGYYITTNATLLTDDVCKLLIENDFRILVSLDGPKSIHDRYRRGVGGSGTFDKIEGNLERLCSLDPEYYRSNVSFNFVVAPPYNFSALNEFVQESTLVRQNRIRTSFVNKQDTTFYNDFSGADTDITDYKQMEAEYQSALVSGTVKPSNPSPKNKLSHAFFGESLDKVAANLRPTIPFANTYHPGGICVPGMKRLMITGEGKLFTCEKSSTTSDLLCLGNVESGLDPKKGMANIESYSGVHDVCRYCVSARNCGTCFVSAHSDGEFKVSTKKQQCNSNRSNLKQQLEHVMTILEQNSGSFDHLKKTTISN